MEEVNISGSPSLEQNEITHNIDTLPLRCSDVGATCTSLLSKQTINIGFKNISYTVPASILSKEKKEILKDVSGLFKFGELTAIMGSSGSGKTSLLNVLSGFIKKGVSGTVYANELPVDTHWVQTKSHSAYIMQEDHLNPLFTPREIMLHAANVKLGSKHNRKSKLQLVESLLERMSMCEAGNTPCRRLSGGERKRLSVCLELIDNPTVLYLDEPTSGLDDTNCRLLVTKLKELAIANRTVICTIHQPSALILSMFHHLYLVHCGRTVYQGDVTCLLPFLKSVGLPCPIFHNPADFIMDTVTGEFGPFSDGLLKEANANNNWRKSSSVESTKDFVPDNLELSWRKRTSPSEWLRYKYLVLQQVKHLHRDWVITYMKGLLHVSVALVLGTLFYNNGKFANKAFNNIAFLLVNSLYICYTTLMPAVLKFPSQLLVLKKEHFNNWYKFTTYFLAFLTVDIPVQLLLTGLFTTISYWLTGQLMEPSRFSIFAAASALETIIANMLGLVCGCIQHPVNGIFLGSMVLFVATMFSGSLLFIKNMSSISRTIASLNFLRYSYELKMTAVYGLDRRKLTCPDEAFYCNVRNPQMIFRRIGLDDNEVARDLTILSIYALISILLAFLQLRYCIKKLR